MEGRFEEKRHPNQCASNMVCEKVEDSGKINKGIKIIARGKEKRKARRDGSSADDSNPTVVHLSGYSGELCFLLNLPFE